MTVEAVVGAAIEIADEQGLESLSMPKLSKSLGIGTMTIYGYVANKRDLLSRMAIALVDDIAVPEGGSWREQANGYFRALRDCALEHRSLPALLAAAPVGTLASAGNVGRLTEAMEQGGLETREAARIFHAALMYTVGFVIWEAGSPVDREPRSGRLDQFEWGLETMLRGASQGTP